MSNYAQLLRDPRWQRKRLERLQASHWQCELCGDATETLHVHHTFYQRNLEPWGYPDEALKVLCATCHKSWHELRSDIQEGLNYLSKNEHERVLRFIETMLGI